MIVTRQNSCRRQNRHRAISRITALILLLNSPAIAMADFNLFSGYTYGYRPGVEAGAGYSTELAPFRLAVNPVSVVMWPRHPPDNRYQEQVQPDGTQICINTRNYQPADIDSCTTRMRVMYAPSAELSLKTTDSIQLGTGFRGGNRSTPYGIVNVYFGGQTYLTIHVSGSYMSYSYGVNF